jgi:hypothetical protein
MFHFTKKRAIVIAVVGSLALGAGAYAYFTSTGTGNGAGSVGSSTAFTVAVSSDATGTLYPGAGSQTLTYNVTNSSSGHQRLSSAIASVASTGGEIMSGTPSAPVSGCLASWFTASASTTNPLPQDLAGSGISSGTVVVTMQNDPDASQDSCQGKAPKILVSPSLHPNGNGYGRSHRRPPRPCLRCDVAPREERVRDQSS